MRPGHAAAPGAIPVIYIVGAGHSGSTLLDLLLGSHSRVEGLGEVAAFDDYFSPAGGMPWSRRGCTCGVHVAHCPYWGRVLARLGQGPGPSARVPARGGSHFADRNAALFDAVRAVSGKPVLCDSSKDVCRLRALLGDARFACQVVHLVRDGRGVAYSYERLARAGDPHPPPWDCYFSALQSWADLNNRIDREFGRLAGTLRVRYEDLTADPEEALRRVLGRVGLRFEPAQVRFRDAPHHNLCGNRIRMSGARVVRRDVEYLTALSPCRWDVGTALVSKTLRTFGYPGERSAAS